MIKNIPGIFSFQLSYSSLQFPTYLGSLQAKTFLPISSNIPLYRSSKLYRQTPPRLVGAGSDKIIELKSAPKLENGAKLNKTCIHNVSREMNAMDFHPLL